jgi:DNA-directed RNA polymerase subunit RPC12/RpoP
LILMDNEASKNENIFLWILEQERQKNRELVLEETTRKSQINTVEDTNHCSKCKKTFDTPKLIQYYACPHCLCKLEEKSKTGCQYWFGFLSQKDKSDSIPQECVECQKVMDCMLNRCYNSENAVSEIKKWY